MNNTDKGLPDSELKVMKLIWDSGKEKISTGEIFEQIEGTSRKL